MIKLDWKLPSAKYEINLYLDPDDAQILNVGERLHWSITRGGLGKDKDGTTKTGRYPTDYFWDWDKDDSGASQSRNSPTVYKDTDGNEYPPNDLDDADRSMEQDFTPTGGVSDVDELFTGKPDHPFIENLKGRAERPVAEQDKYQLSAARRDAMILIEMGVWGIPEGRSPLSWVRECSARMFYSHHATVMEPEHFCYTHETPWSPVKGGTYAHRITIDEQALFCTPNGIVDGLGNLVEG